MDLGKHAVFIWMSYAAVVSVLVAIIVWLIVDGRRQRMALAELEARGVKRRSSEAIDQP